MLVGSPSTRGASRDAPNCKRSRIERFSLPSKRCRLLSLVLLITVEPLHHYVYGHSFEAAVGPREAIGAYEYRIRPPARDWSTHFCRDSFVAVNNTY